MKRLKSTLAMILLVSAGAAAIGLGTVMAVAALVIGLVVAGAARLAVSAQKKMPLDEKKSRDMGIVDAQLTTAS
ncbi:hypothetical protein [uncultured Paracoccus sp.]|uniref:hypothetical protein n=1 Tax=uncultured Paracoccus sp. TaxID=189685 RepID=UPI00262EAB54|nr:hypothetical protein [uncultured Paracoccus sp.]